jgi:hypothetical protein
VAKVRVSARMLFNEAVDLHEPFPVCLNLRIYHFISEHIRPDCLKGVTYILIKRNERAFCWYNSMCRNVVLAGGDERV